VKNQTYHFEIKDVLTQFVAAFDDIIIKRYDKNRIPQSLLQVRYVYSPKQRVMYDLVNKAMNITIPVVAININSVSRDESRVFNKIGGFYYPRGTTDNDKKSSTAYYRSPVPVNIDISMSILTKFQSDMDQIISNFVPYNNPYIIISWRVPDGLVNPTLTTAQEIRSEVLWNGSINLSYPTELNGLDKYKIVGDTSFTIKSWLFPATSNDASNIFFINNNFYNSRLLTNYDILTSTSFTYPLSTGLVSDTETASVSGSPSLTNVDYAYS
jgi:hypothetical protein